MVDNSIPKIHEIINPDIHLDWDRFAKNEIDFGPHSTSYTSRKYGDAYYWNRREISAGLRALGLNEPHDFQIRQAKVRFKEETQMAMAQLAGVL